MSSAASAPLAGSRQKGAGAPVARGGSRLRGASNGRRREEARGVGHGIAALARCRCGWLRGARATVTCLRHQGRARTGLDFSPIRRKGPQPYPLSGCVLGPVYPSNPELLGPEKSIMSPSSWPEEESGGRRTSGKPFNIANGGYSRGM